MNTTWKTGVVYHIETKGNKKDMLVAKTGESKSRAQGAHHRQKKKNAARMARSRACKQRSLRRSKVSFSGHETLGLHTLKVAQTRANKGHQQTLPPTMLTTLSLWIATRT